MNRRDAIALALSAAGALLLATAAPLALAILGAALFVSGVALRPWVASVGVVLSLPFYLHPRTLLGLELSGAEITIVLGIATAVLARLRSRGLTPPVVTPSPVDWAVALFLLSAALSLLVTEYPKQTLRELRWLIIEPVALFYLARWTIPRQRTSTLLWAVVASGCVAAASALVGAGLGGDLLHLSVRVAGPYLSPNHLGLFLGRAMPVALALALFGADRRLGATAIAWSSFALMGLALLRSTSIGAWVGVAVATLALMALRGRRWLVATLAALVLLAALALVSLPLDRTIARFDPGTGTGLFRLQIWSAALHMAADHPLLGVGLDNFLYQYQAGYMLAEAWEEPNISHPHNFVLNFWLELGVLGLATILGLIVWVARAAHRSFWNGNHPSSRVLGASTLGMLLDFVVHGSFDNSYFLVDAAVLWWLIIALLLVDEARAPTHRERAGTRAAHAPNGGVAGNGVEWGSNPSNPVSLEQP